LSANDAAGHPDFDANPFGSRITAADLLDNLTFFDSWEDRYRYIIDLGRELPTIPPSLRSDETLVRGCQSQVWLLAECSDGRMRFLADSDAFIVKGLLAVVLAAYNDHTPAAIVNFDIDGYFATLDLMRHLSATRGNGLNAMVRRIKDLASAHA